MARIKDAIVGFLLANSAVTAWATGGVHVRRAPGMPDDSTDRRRDKYIVVRVSDSEPEHWQVGPSELTTDRIDVLVVASSSREADWGANLVRIALDGLTADYDSLFVQRIFWRGTTDREFEDASGAEQLLDAAQLTFDVGYSEVIAAVVAEEEPGTPRTVEITVTADAHINEDQPTTTHDGNNVLFGFLAGRISRALVHVNLSPWLATLGGETPTPTLAKLFVRGFSTNGPFAAKVRQLTETGWVESEVTWNRASVALDWPDGGEFTAVNEGDITVPDIGTDWYEFTVPVAHVIDAIANQSGQLHLILMKLEADETTPGRMFFNSVNFGGTTEPYLYLEFTV